MSENVPDLRAGLDYLQRELSKNQDFVTLEKLENQARMLLRHHSNCLELALIVGVSLQKSQEWERATSWYLEQCAAFPGQHILKYDAAQTAVNGGDYERAQQICEDLGRVITVLSDSQLRGIWRISPFVALPEVALDAFNEASRRGVAHCTPKIQARINTAASNAVSSAIQEVGLISIGENCFPWIFGNRWGLRPKTTLFQQESPWNLAQTWTNDIAALLETDLDNLINTQLLSVVEVVPGIGQAVNNTYRFEFNHDLGSFFLENQFTNLISRYQTKLAKIETFFAARPCVYLLYSEREGDLTRLAKAVLNKCAHRMFRLVIVDVWAGTREFTAPDRRVSYLRISLPASGYVWFLPDHWDGDDGIDFERAIQNHVVEAIGSLYSELNSPATQ